MDIIRCIVVAMIICLFCYEIGWAMNGLIKNTNISNMSVGFISMLALFQIVALPFMWFESQFTSLYIVCLLLAGIVTIYVLLNIRNIGNDIKKIIPKEKLLWMLAIGIIVMQMIGYIILQHSDADDAFFVTEISTILETNYINKFDCTTGIQDYIFNP